MTQAERQRKRLDLDRVFDALQRPLELIDDPERRADLQRLIEAGRVHQERAIFDLLSEVTESVNEAGSNAHARLEYHDGHVHMAVEVDVGDEAQTDPLCRMDESVEKVTLRLPARLKVLIDGAANARGVSVNAWYVRTLARAIFHQTRGRLHWDDLGERRRRPGRPGRPATPDAD